MDEPIELLIFDLGGVIIEFSGLVDVGRLIAGPVEADEIRRRWLDSPAIRDFELGTITPQEFGERFVSEWGLQVTPAAFLDQFRHWNRRVLPGAAELLGELRSGYRLACLSNSNELHWEANQRFDLTGLFDACFSSHELGLYKPDPAAYRAVLEAMRVHPERALFFDDNEVNVDGALSAGLRSHLVAGVSELRAQLASSGAIRAVP